MKTGIKISVICILSLIVLSSLAMYQVHDGPYQATGIKIGEVTPSSVILWTRLTLNPQRIGSDAPQPTILYKDSITGKPRTIKGEGRPSLEPVVIYPDGYNVNNIDGAVPGTPGRVRVVYKTNSASQWQMTDWKDVAVDHDFTHQFKLDNLQSETEYELRVECQSMKGEAGQVIEGKFTTAPPPDRPVKVIFTVVTGQNYKTRDDGARGYKIYPLMLKLNPSFFVHTGDIVYYDQFAKNIDLARWHWQCIYSLPSHLEFHRLVNCYFIKDDHDTWMDDCYPHLKTKFMGDFTFKQGQQVFLDEVPMSDSTWRTFRWGKDLQIWLPEGRDFRSDNYAPDGPQKTIWGEKQKEWFKRSVRASDATFRVLISPTPIVGPDRGTKNDNHANVGFTHEGNELREFIASQKNMIVICGDRHWQYVSKDLKTGLHEYSCGPQTDKHAGGWSNDRVLPEHEYLNVVGGFLAAIVDRIDGKPVITLRHYSVDGKILHEDQRFAQ